MDENLSLRERKKEATRQQLARAALDLFEERGFDNVSCAQIAATAEVSKKTLFNYFSLKADLVLDAGRHRVYEPAAVVRDRAPEQTPHGAVREYLLTALAERRAMSGLSDDPDLLRLARLIHTTPSIAERDRQYQDESQRLLAEALIEEGCAELTAQLMSAQIHSVLQTLVAENVRRVLAGAAPDDIYPDAVAEAEDAFRLLEFGLGNLMRRPARARRQASPRSRSGRTILHTAPKP